MYEPIHPRSPLETMPTMYDLPSELIGESGLPDEFHCIQADLLTETCKPVGYLPEEILLTSDLNLYYDPRHTQWYKRPDWYMVIGTKGNSTGRIKAKLFNLARGGNAFFNRGVVVS